MVIVLLGPPGAGKGTQCKRIVDRFKLTHLSSGDILRSERTAGTELGKKAQSFMDAGKLVPDDLIIAMMSGAITKAKGNCVLDGFPRTVVQASELDRELERKGNSIDAIVNLVIDDSVVENRITGRRSCPACGAVYHLESLKPKVDGFCDKCKGQSLTQRVDDTPDVIRERLKTYHQQTSAVVGYYTGAGGEVLDVDADRAIDAVTAEIIKNLESLILAK
ncbi:MAG TPA: adenylate kinase [Phycisphaerales bacterium]|jgi:adenylate kinase|nr:MAG: adenylate kinase [Planctomycetes bacterium GWC2_45_44]HBG78859.1 adenylate kinase [Phycisphaerales bacterium]HBR20519.1 adenylate kinase [Phycisphaerales bacterium]